MNVTVGELIQELQRYPATMPVWIECSKTYYDHQCDCSPDSIEFSEATDIKFMGNHVLIGCD